MSHEFIIAESTSCSTHNYSNYSMIMITVIMNSIFIL